MYKGFPLITHVLSFACLVMLIVYEHRGEMVKYNLNLALDNETRMQNKALEW